MSEQLTAEGRAWALEHSPSSITARIALSGTEWPTEHRETAIAVCNANGKGEKGK